jgi:hypothetical protein
MTRAARSAYEELLLSPVGALARYRDADGRPLCGEAIVSDPDFRSQLELRRCPYPGSRRHHALPMNVSALKQMTRSWPLLLGTAQLVARALGPTGGAPTTARLMRAASAAVSLPLFLLYRDAGPMGDGQVPGFVSGLHKASIDVATGAQLMLIDDPLGPLERGALLQFVEQHGLFIGEAGVCAGPPLMIEELVRVLSGEEAAPERGCQDAAAALGDLRGLPAYVDAILALTVARQLIGAHLRRGAAALRERCAAMAADQPGSRKRFEQLCEVLARHPVPTRPSEVIRRQDRLLEDLPAEKYEQLLDALAEGRAALTPSPAEEPGSELLAHLREAPPPDVADVMRVVALAGRRAEPFAVALAEAIVDAARLERRALSFYTSIEAAIRRALGQPCAAGALTSEQLASVFGPSPARYVGQLVAISVAIGDGHIAYSSAPRGLAAQPLSL